MMLHDIFKLMSLEKLIWTTILNYLWDLHLLLWFMKQNQLMKRNVLKRYLISLVIDDQIVVCCSSVKVKLGLMIDTMVFQL